MKAKRFFNRIGCFICTKEIFEDRQLSMSMYKYFLIGIMIRMLFIPFFFQRDILSTYQRAAETVFAGNIGADFQQLLTHLIHSGYLFLIKPFLPAASQLSSILLNQDTWTSWIGFNSMDYVYRILTMFKLPYLALDIASMFLLIRLLYDGEPLKKLKVFKYWVFNPLVIFVLYIFARHDIIGIFVTLVALLLAKNGRKYWAIIILSFGIALRFFPVMILPFMIFYLSRKKKDYMILFSIGIAGLIAVEAFSYVYFGRSVIFSLLNAQHFDYILSAKIDLIIHDRIYLFVVAYFLLFFAWLHQKQKSFMVFLNYCGMVYLLYVSISYFHPQYLLWSVPFLVFLFVRRESLYYYHWAQMAFLMVILIYWGDLVTKFLIAPIDIRTAMYGTGLIPLIGRLYEPAKFVNIFRSVFTAISIWMIYLIYRDNKAISIQENKTGTGSSI
ncbi:MAG: hypothetical protein BWY60_00822 [Actinobacteria bacterium ADurb.Bin346]|nr:MAG: hypothetical protein BWY60_00822 [Actinobacteria bacterium ADurb.Bin346]